MAHSYASLLAKKGITANSITPALIETDMLKELNVTPDIIPMKRFGKPEEVAEAVVMLVKNAYVTGQTLGVNGGMYFS